MKIKVGVFFGSRSVEHEVSIITALQAIKNINKEIYDVVPIYISKEGYFYTGDALLDIDNYKDMPKLISKVKKLMFSINYKEPLIFRYSFNLLKRNLIDKIDVAFPIIHGTNGEDGTIQALFELLGIPYVGCNLLSSAVNMDKITVKAMLNEHKIPTPKYIWFYSKEFFKSETEIIKLAEKSLNYPMVVKPANLGSSVGVTKVNNQKELRLAVENACCFSNRIIIDEAVNNLKEINCSVVGDYENQEASVCEEPISSGEILSYNDKYVGKSDGNSNVIKRRIPADISEDLSNEIRCLSRDVFRLLDCNGVVRIDFLVDTKNNQVYVNELNTIPGSLAFYLWEKSDKEFSKLIDELIGLAFKKYREQEKLMFTYDSNILSFGGKFGKSGQKR